MKALEGLKVVEAAAYAAGPVVGKHLVDQGATVVHIESRTRPDGFRTHYPPYKDNIHGLNRSGLFALCNSEKLGVTLNLKKGPEALALAKRIVELGRRHGGELQPRHHRPAGTGIRGLARRSTRGSSC